MEYLSWLLSHAMYDLGQNDTKGSTLVKAINHMWDIYKQGGLEVDRILMDGQLKPLQGEISGLGLQLNDVAEDKHVGKAERYIWTVKEWCHSACTVLPFKCITRRMVIEMVRWAVVWLNAFPNKHGVSHTLSTRTIVTGRNIDHNKHCRYEFGQYVQVHDKHENTMQP